MKVQKTRYCSVKIGDLPKGCQLCVKGLKSVLFVTGLCAKHCFYCPISEHKYNKDVIYINERPAKNIRDVIEEIRLCSSDGVGITGGDPLMKISRTASFIKKLKGFFGKKFHIHLYTPLNLVNKTSLKRLYNSGLDEIRFHPSLENSKEWSKVILAKKFGWKVGVEIPVIPGKEKETKRLIGFLAGKIGFLNLNELEYSDTNAFSLEKLGFRTKDKLSYGIKGSEELALRLLVYCKGKIRNVHYCTTTLKDRVQLANRIKKRARNIAKKYDIVNKDGTLTRGVAYLKELIPSFGYNLLLKKMDKRRRKRIAKELNEKKSMLKKKFKIIDELISVDIKKLRILTSVDIIKKIKNELKAMGLMPAIVNEYPTWDQLEIDVDFL